jgi:hypothetical protein
MPRLLLVLLLALLSTSALTPAASAADPNPEITVFMAEPNADYSEITFAAMIKGEPFQTHEVAIDGTTQCGEWGFDFFEELDPVTADKDGYAYFFRTVRPTDDPSHLRWLTIRWGPTGFTRLYNCYPLGPDNTGWTTAEPVALSGGSGTQSGEIGLDGEARWYKLNLPADAKATITASDVDTGGVAVFRDIEAAEDQTDAKGDGLDTHDLLRLGASLPEEGNLGARSLPSRFIPSRFIPSRFIPSRFIPSRFIPSRFIPSRFIGSAFSGESFSPSRFIGDAFAADAFSPSRFIPSRFIPSRFIGEQNLPSRFIPSNYSSAVTQSFVAADFSDGDQQSVTVNSWNKPGDYYVAVTGAQSTQRFQLDVEVQPSDCSGVAEVPGAPAAAPATGADTVILTDSERLDADAGEQAHLAAQLEALAARPEVDGAIVDLAAEERVRALRAQADARPECPYAQTLVARAIKDVVERHREANPDLKYVVIVGGDDVIPFFRQADETPLGNERDYEPPVEDGTHSQSSLRRGYVLTDDPYGATQGIDVKGQPFPLPGLAVGRLVETAPEISRVVQAYLDTDGGVVPTPRNSLVTSYDFLTPAADLVRQDLAAGTGAAPDVLRDPYPASQNPWTGAELAAKLTAQRYDLMYLGGHFSANNALAADFKTDVVTTELDQSDVDLTNAIVISPGCHSAYNIVDGHAVPGLTLPLDWAQAFARKGATLIGGTGYQYGDTDFVEYSLRLYAGLTKQLRHGSGPVPLGVALARAKQAYLEETPQLGEIHQKSLLEATLFGLPMTSVNLPEGRAAPPADEPSIVGSTTNEPNEPGATLGLARADVSIVPQLTEQTKVLTADGGTRTASYLRGRDGVVTNPHQPVLPLEKRNVTVPGKVLRGVAFRGGTWQDEPDVTPLTGAPATESSEPHVPWDSDVLFPLRTSRVNSFGALARPDGPQRLMVTPAQHRAQDDGEDLNVRRRFTKLDYRLYYSANTTTYGQGDSADTPALSAAPDIGQVEGVPDGDEGLLVCAEVGGNPAAGVQTAFATWTDGSKSSGEWASVDLAQGGCDADAFPGRQDSKHWGARIAIGAVEPEHVRFMVQAVNGVGLVSLSDERGAYHEVEQDLDADGTKDVVFEDVTIDADRIASGGRVRVRAILREDLWWMSELGEPVPGQPVRLSIGDVSGTAWTDADGVAEAELELKLPPGTYPVAATFDGSAITEGDARIYLFPARKRGPAVTVDASTRLLLTREQSDLAPGESRFLARLCGGLGSGCSGEDIGLPDRLITFTLEGPDGFKRALGARTDANGVARVSQFGLAPGPYDLNAEFAGSEADALAPASAALDFESSFADTEPPELQVPGGIVTDATGPDGAVVRFAARATDAVDPRPRVTCAPGSVSLFPTGTTEVECVATDTAGNRSSRTFGVRVRPPDRTPPEVVPGVEGTLGDDGWYTSDVALSWEVEEPDSDITSTTGCGPTSITADQPSTVYTCSAVSAGGTGEDSVAIKRDATPPAVAVVGVADGGRYSAGLVPDAGCDTRDPTSGVRTVASPTTRGGPLGVVTVTCAGAIDNAGNAAAPERATYTVADPTPPQVTPVVKGTLGRNGWHTGDVSLAWTVEEPESAVTTTGCDAIIVAADQPEQAYICKATSEGGETSRTVRIKRDATPPGVAVTGVSDGGRYALGAVPAAGCQTTDATSGVALAASLSESGGPLGDVTVTCAGAVDDAGNAAAPVRVTYTVLDGTPPQVEPVVGGTIGSDGWYTSDVSLAWTVAEPESAVTKTGCDAVLVAADQPERAYTCKATSVGGETSRTVTIKRDATKPQVRVTGVADGAVYAPGAVPAAGCSTTDATSGVARAATLTVSGGPLGTVTATCAGARDQAGNTGQARVGYAVRWPFAGFAAPVDGRALNAATAGNAIPVKFSLGGNRGLGILAAGSPRSQRIDCATNAPVGAAATAASTSGLTYDARSQQYSWVWKTDKAWAGTCRRLDLALADGATHSARFRFK